MQKEYWCGKVMDDDVEFGMDQQNPDKFESNPPSMKAGIRIRKLRKVHIIYTFLYYDYI